MSSGTEQATEKLGHGRARGVWSRLWRGLTGSLAAGLAVLAVIVLGVALVCLFRSVPGPGALVAIGHPVAAVAALGAQWVADHRDGRTAGIAGAAVPVIAGLALWLLWLN